MNPPIFLAGNTPLELAELAGRGADSRLRGRQIAAWIYERGATEFWEMTDLPEALRKRLGETCRVSPLKVLKETRAADGVIKLLVHSGDKQGFECVLLPYEDRVSCCLSTQVGCAMGCGFCATGLGGFDRNLDAGEIVGQYLLLQGLSERRISHVVFMGMGEPLLNYESLLKSLRLLHDEVGLSYRHITVSTVGIVPKIVALADEQLPIHLAISLHSAVDEVRDRLMPVNKKWNVDTLISACRQYVETTGRKITFEYLLIQDVTDTLDQAEALAKKVKGLQCLVNLIPFNPVSTPDDYKAPSKARVRAFRALLERKGINVSQRMERGQEISAACGQLAGEHAGKFRSDRSFKLLPLSS